MGLWFSGARHRRTPAFVRPHVVAGRGALSASPHPFAASAGELAEALKELTLYPKPTAKRACHVTAWLPTKGSSPVPSSSLIAEPSKSRAKTKLAAWVVPAYRLSAEEAVELLCASAGRRTLAAGVIVGPDLAYWTEALRFGGSMVARQQYLPGLTADRDEFHATWDPRLCRCGRRTACSPGEANACGRASDLRARRNRAPGNAFSRGTKGGSWPR